MATNVDGGFRLVSWNVARRDVHAELESVGADLAMLQEAGANITRWPCEIVPSSPEGWRTGGGPRRIWRTAIARLSDRVAIQPHELGTLDAGRTADELCVSLDGSITAADVFVGGQPLLTAISIYSAWEMSPGGRGYADASAHRILSDLTALLAEPRLPVVVAGDWNLLRDYGELGSDYWRQRYATVFDRAETLGLVFAGPAFPNGRRADPWPSELPSDSACVPTFHHGRQTPTTASRQLDFVLVSESLADRVHVWAMNDPTAWGPSDHCRVIIDVE